LANNNGKNIKGYRDLSQEEIDMMNEAKEIAEAVGNLCDKLSKNEKMDQRWIKIGTTDLQKGFMSLIRGIAQPTSF